MRLGKVKRKRKEECQPPKVYFWKVRRLGTGCPGENPSMWSLRMNTNLMIHNQSKEAS